MEFITGFLINLYGHVTVLCMPHLLFFFKRKKGKLELKFYYSLKL